MKLVGDVPEVVAAMKVLPGTRLAPPAPLREIERLEAFAGARLPEAHRQLLLISNGLSVSWGYRRVFGVGDGHQDIGPWNCHQTWKFAWTRPLEDFLCIGQTGWGDQFAYKLSDLRRGIEKIHWLDRFLMETAKPPIAVTFEGFLANLVSHARRPDEKVHEALRQIGELEQHQLALFQPSPLIVGLERATRLTKVHTQSALVMNGDMATQLLNPVNETRKVERFDIFMDELGRLRIGVRWHRA
jgi:hypothetical protein